MNPELSERQRQALATGRQAFVLALACMVVAAAGLWSRHYGEPLSIGIAGLLVALGAGLVAMIFLGRWLLAIRDRRAPSPVLPPAPEPPTE